MEGGNVTRHTTPVLAGIYIHIPFCKSKCAYCDFYSQTDRRPVSDYVKALCLELRLRRGYLRNEPVETIYFGGGTPGLLVAADLNRILSEIYGLFPVIPDPEITLEANPDDLTPEYVAGLKTLPVNRVSIGIQSFDDGELQFLNRRHTADKAVKAVENCRQAGFGNISIDLMYGLPGQTVEAWEKTLDRAVQLNIQHISSYHLIYEIGTPLYQKLESGKITPAEEDTSIKMFDLLIDRLTSNGFIHYEISNFAKPGYISRHNSSYWKNIDYLGIGASAHSYRKTSRDYNVSDTEQYIRSIFTGKLPATSEPIDRNTAYNDYIITSLRTVWGISAEKIKSEFGVEKEKYCLEQARKYLSGNLLTYNDDTLKLTRKGLFVSDGIMADLLWV